MKKPFKSGEYVLALIMEKGKKDRIGLTKILSKMTPQEKAKQLFNDVGFTNALYVIDEVLQVLEDYEHKESIEDWKQVKDELYLIDQPADKPVISYPTTQVGVTDECCTCKEGKTGRTVDENGDQICDTCGKI